MGNLDPQVYTTNASLEPFLAGSDKKPSLSSLVEF